MPWTKDLATDFIEPRLSALPSLLMRPRTTAITAPSMCDSAQAADFAAFRAALTRPG
jgi:hypothetical protein